jgi:hypothetical protein
MAYMNQEKKAKIAVAIKPILKKYGIKGTLSVRSHSTIVLTLKSGKIDFGGKNLDINPYWFHEHFKGAAKDFLTEAFDALKSADWYDRTNSMIDYFDTAYYADINVGKWNQPYEVVS